MIDLGELRELARRYYPPPVDAEEVTGRVEELAETGDPARLSDAAKLDAITALERLKNAAAAAQARLSVAFESSQRDELEAHGVRRAAASKSIGTQLALARRESPHRGCRHLGLA